MLRYVGDREEGAVAFVSDEQRQAEWAGDGRLVGRSAKTALQDMSGAHVSTVPAAEQLSMSALIQVKGVSKLFPSHNSTGDVLALDDVTLEVGQGELLSILGPSGCGKSTLLMLVGGLLLPSSGTVLVGTVSPEEARRARKFGFVFQDPVLFDWRTVRENVELPGELFGDEAIKERSQEVISLVGLDGFEDAFPHELSGGMRSRVAIARALVYRPRVLLMDEPFADLDEITRLKMNLEILRLRDQTKATILFVTHSVREAAFLADRVIALSDRPASVQAVFQVPLPRPRRPTMVDSSEFQEFTGKLRTLLASRVDERTG